MRKWIHVSISKREDINHQSGWKWTYSEREHGPEWMLISPSGGHAASVYGPNGTGGHNWFVWDEEGISGENSSEETVERAMFMAESATLRWGQHE